MDAKRLHAAVAVLGLMLGLSIMPLLGQEPPDKPPAKSTGEKGPDKTKGNLLDLDLEQLGKVEVRPKGSAQTSGSGTVITPSQVDLQQSSIGQLFERAPGVSLRRTTALNLDPRVRGYQSSQINANANGMTQYRSRIDIDSLFSQIDSGNIQSLTVVDGPYTSIWGPGYAFLSVDLITPKRFECGPEHHWASLVSQGTNGAPLYNRDQVWGGGADWGYYISYGLRVGSDYRAGDGLRVPASYNQQDVFAALSFDLSAETRLDFNYIRLGLRNLELPGITYAINRQTTDQFSVRWVAQEDRSGPEQAVLQFWTQRTPFNGNATRASTQNTFFRTLLGTPSVIVGDDVSGSLLGGTMDGSGLTESWGARVLRTFGEKNGPLWTIGADWRRLHMGYLETDYDNLGQVAFSGNFYGIPDSNQDDFGLFTHAKFPVSSTLDFTAGGRIDWVHSSLGSAGIITQTPPTNPNGYYRPGFNEPTQTLVMGYTTLEARPREWLTLNTGVGFAMRAPNLVELYNDEPYQPIGRFGNSYADGDSNLRPERNIQFDLGASYHQDDFRLGVRGFHANIQNYILPVAASGSTFVSTGVAAPTNLLRNYSAFGFDPNDPNLNGNASTASLAYRYTNLDRATLTGFDVTAQYRFSPWCTIDATVGYVYGVMPNPVRYQDDTQQVIALDGSEPIPGIYPLNSTIRFQIIEPRTQKWGLELAARMVAGQNRVADRYGELPTAGFTTFDASGYYQLTKHLRVFTTIENLLDRTYTEHGSLAISNVQGTLLRFVPERGFTLILGLEARF